MDYELMLKAIQKDFFRRGIVALIMISLLPLLVSISGIWIVSQYGRVPGGTTVTCERIITDDLIFRIEQYQYQSGLQKFEIQTFSVSYDQQKTWIEIFQDDVQSPIGISCDEHIQVLADDGFVLFSQKSIALSPNAQAWNIHHVCDDPRPTTKRCDEDALNIAEVQIEDLYNSSIRIEESVLNEFGEPMTENGNRLLRDTYILTTDNAGMHWSLTED